MSLKDLLGGKRDADIATRRLRDDVRQPEEYEAAHVPGAVPSSPGRLRPMSWLHARRHHFEATQKVPLPMGG